jgi:hypothetical protein
MTYGQGAGIFFIGCFILEVPSNLSLEKFGASKWIARIMISWGLISGAFALLGGPTSLALAAAGRWRWCGRGRGPRRWRRNGPWRARA